MSATNAGKNRTERFLGKGTRRRHTAVAAAVLALSFGVFGGMCLYLSIPMADVQVYRAEGEAALRGGGLYGFTVTKWDLPATYPPFAALLFVPAAMLPLSAAKAAFILGNTALLALLVHQSARLVGRRAPTPVLLIVTAVALWLEPVFQTLIFGQINLLLACLVLWDLSLPDSSRYKGLAIGVAAGIKLTPAIFAVHLLVTGRVRAAFTAFGGFMGTVLVGAFFLPADSVEFWARRIFETGRVGKAWIVDNQSLQGLVARFLHVPEPGLFWLLPAVLVGALGLWLARRAHVVHRLPGWALLCTAFTALLISPISWTHHWVWCVPLLAALVPRRPHGTASGGGGQQDQAGRAWWRVEQLRVNPRAWVCAAVALVFLARTMWLIPKDGPRDLRLPWWQQALASPYALLALALLAVLAWRVWSGPGTLGPRDGFVAGSRGGSAEAAGRNAAAADGLRSTEAGRTARSGQTAARAAGQATAQASSPASSSAASTMR